MPQCEEPLHLGSLTEEQEQWLNDFCKENRLVSGEILQLGSTLDSLDYLSSPRLVVPAYNELRLVMDMDNPDYTAAMNELKRIDVDHPQYSKIVSARADARAIGLFEEIESAFDMGPGLFWACMGSSLRLDVSIEDHIHKGMPSAFALYQLERTGETKFEYDFNLQVHLITQTE